MIKIADEKEIDESQIPVKMLFRILPEEAINELAKSLFKDIIKSPPSFFTVGGEELFTNGSVDIICGHDEVISPDITTTPDVGKEAVESIVSSGIDYDKRQELESMNYDVDDIVYQIGLFILSNINGVSDLHNYASDLFREIGALAFYRDEGTINTSDLKYYIDKTIEKHVKNANDIKTRYYYIGVQKHMNVLLKSNKIKNIKNAIDVFNNSFEDDYRISAYDRVDLSYDDEVVNNVLGYILNPIEFLKDNQDMMINLTEYEQQHGQLPRQYELPGLEQT